MAATTVQPIPYSQTPVISQQTREKLSQERKRLASDPNALLVPADLSTNAKYVFRTKPHTYRQLVVTLPMPPDEANFPGEPAQFNFVKRRWDRVLYLVGCHAEGMVGDTVVSGVPDVPGRQAHIGKLRHILLPVDGDVVPVPIGERGIVRRELDM